MGRNTLVSALAVLGLAAAAAVTPAPAEAAQFLSLYHRPDLRWYTIETEHFLVHYPISRKGPDKNEHYTNGEWAARKVAKVSEQYYGPMCEEFDYYLQEKTHVVVLEQYDQLQGFTIPARNWVEISGNPGSTFYRLRGRSEWFSNVLVHEFAHVVSLKKNQAMAENVPALVGSVLYTNNAIGGGGGSDLDTESGAQLVLSDRTEPWWWTEGGAEYWSSRAGYNWWTSGRDRHIRNTVLEDRFLTYDEWKSRQSWLTWGDGERGYQQGHSIALYLRMRFGQTFFAELAKEHDRGWRAHWETMIEEKTGMTGRALYEDWKAWIKDYYGRFYADVIAEGEVKGLDLQTSKAPYVFDTPADRDKFFTQEKKVWGKTKKKVADRRSWEAAKDATGRYESWPKMSDDGRWLGQAGFVVSRTDERLLPGRTANHLGAPANQQAALEAQRLSTYIPDIGGSTFDFVPGQDKVVITMREDVIARATKRYWALNVETDGYNWNQLVLVDLEPRTETEKHGPVGDEKVEYQTLKPKKQKGSGYFANWRTKPRTKLTPIPNTKRGSDPAISPDGKRIAYLEYGDGSNNLVLIDIDGQNKKVMTDFRSGELLQSVDWSPDGKQLVFAVFKNYQQDIWFMDVATGEVRALNQDETEDLDVHWSMHDGNIYFSSDLDGVYNVYRYDPKSGRIHQLTNVAGSAYTPSLTPSGDLLYNNFTAFGEKNMIVPKDEFLEKDVTDRFGLDYDDDRARASWAYVEDLSEYEALTSRYQGFRRFHPPAVIPIFRVRNPSLPTFAIDTGVQVSAFDVGEKHELLAFGLVGTNFVFQGGYTYRGWHPEISIFFTHAESKSDFGYLLDDDSDKTTTDDQDIYEFRQNTYQNAMFVTANYPLNQSMRLNASVILFEFGFRGVADEKFSPFNRSISSTLGLEFSNLNYGLDIGSLMFSARGINPTGRYVTLDLTHGFTDHVSEDNNGVYTDDGQRLDKYNFNSFQFRWSEHLPFPFITKARSKGHKLQFDLQLGAIDRNVALFDELRIRSGHPMTPGVGNGSIQSTQVLSGFPDVLLGETMAVGGLYYRFPIKAVMNERWGPLLVRDVYVQAGGSAGNLWSYLPPEEDDIGTYYFDDRGNRIAYDPKDVKREIPFVSEQAYKNGNYLLTDVSAEVRVSSLLMNSTFNSFLRVSYGFQEVGGIFDIDGDDINDTTNSGFGNAKSLETEKPGPRIFLGIGSGW